MGLLDGLENQVLGNMMGGGNSNPLVAGILQMIQSQPGGLQGLVQTFHDKGLGGIASSWVSTGQNQPISADQIHQTLGSDVEHQRSIFMVKAFHRRRVFENNPGHELSIPFRTGNCRHSGLTSSWKTCHTNAKSPTATVYRLHQSSLSFLHRQLLVGLDSQRKMDSGMGEE